MRLDNKGSSSISLIAVMLLVFLFIIFPLITVVYENYYTGIISREIVGCIDTSMASVFGDINLESTTGEHIDYGASSQARFSDALKKNLSLNEELEADDKGFSKISITEFEVIPKLGKDPTALENVDRETIHIKLIVYFKPIFISFSDDDMREKTIHYDYKVPIDN